MKGIKLTELRKRFNEFIREKINLEHKLIFKSNLELMRTYYEFLYYCFNDMKICDKYLNSFGSIENISTSNIESNFSSLILSNKKNHLNLSKIDNVKNSGIYFIFDEYGEIIYVGKSNNLNSRSIQSFLNKLPLGSYSLKLMEIESESIDLIEAIIIDYLLPIYNNKLEGFPKIRYRTYSTLINRVINKLNDIEAIYPLERNTEEITISVFETI